MRGARADGVRGGYRDTSGRAMDMRRSRSPALPRWWQRVRAGLRRLFEARRGFVVQGVRYTELDAIPLRRALARSLEKRYRVAFPDGARMTIEATPARRFADVQGDSDIGEFTTADPVMRPGDRVLCLAAGTGYGAAWLGARVGPTGAVVALEPDAPSVRYARHRYRADNIAFEAGGLDELRGELDGAFDVVIHRRCPTQQDAMATTLQACWRLLAAGGGMVVLLDKPTTGRTDPRADPRLDAVLDALRAQADADPPGIRRVEPVRVFSRPGLLLQRAGGEDGPAQPPQTPTGGRDDGPGGQPA